MLGLGAARVAGQAVPLAQRAELGHPPGQELVHVGLVTGIEHDPVGRRLEDAVQGHGQLNDAQVRPEVPARP